MVVLKNKAQSCGCRENNATLLFPFLLESHVVVVLNKVLSLIPVQ